MDVLELPYTKWVTQTRGIDEEIFVLPDVNMLPDNIRDDLEILSKTTLMPGIWCVVRNGKRLDARRVEREVDINSVRAVLDPPSRAVFVAMVSVIWRRRR